MDFADQRVLQNVPATLSVTFVDQDGSPADPGVVTVGIVRADGTVLQAPLGATVDPGTPAGYRTFDVTAAQTALLDHLTCTWTASTGQIMTTHVDVVGAYYFPVTDLSALDGMTGLSTEQLIAGRQAVEEIVERRTHWAWTPRLVVETFGVRNFTSSTMYGIPWSNSIVLSHRPARVLRAILVDGVAETLTNWSLDEWGFLGTPYGWQVTWLNQSTVKVIYEIGEPHPPQSLIRSMLDAARLSGLESKSGVSPRALSTTNEFGNINYARATVENVFGNPAVDAVLAFWDRRQPAIA